MAEIPAAREAHAKCPIEKLRPWSKQPRQNAADSEHLDELAASMRTSGVIEPLVVRRVPGCFDEFEILAGERRWLGAQRAGLHDVPIIVRDCPNDTEALILALTENSAREELPLADFAIAVHQLRQETGQTLEQLATQIGCSPTYISQCQQLMHLPEPVLQLNREGRLQAASLLALRHVRAPEVATELAQRAVAEKLTVREVTQLADSAKETRRRHPRSGSPRGRKSAGVRDLEMRFARRLGLRCEITHQPKGFRLTLQGTLDQLDVMVEQLEI